MIPRLFSTLITALFLIATHGQSHSAELTQKLYIPESLSNISYREQAVEFWKDHLDSSNLDRVAVRNQFSEISFDYEYLWKVGFDVLDVNAVDKNCVFTNVSFVFSPNNRYQNDKGFEEWKMLKLVEALTHSQVTILNIKGGLTPNLGEALVTLLEGSKTFQELKISLCHEKFRGDDFLFQMSKKIGIAATGKVEKLFINDGCYSSTYTFRSTKESPFDFSAFSVEEKLKEIKIANQKQRKKSEDYDEQQRQKRQKEEQERQTNLDYGFGLIAKGAVGVVAVVATYYGIKWL